MWVGRVWLLVFVEWCTWMAVQEESGGAGVAAGREAEAEECDSWIGSAAGSVAAGVGRELRRGVCEAAV